MDKAMQSIVRYFLSRWTDGRDENFGTGQRNFNDIFALERKMTKGDTQPTWPCILVIQLAKSFIHVAA